MSGYFGLSAGTATWAPVDPDMFCGSRFQNTVGNGNVTQIEILFDDASPTGNVKLGMYEDIPGVPEPDALSVYAGNAAVADGWVVIGGLLVPVTFGTWYWLTFVLQNFNDIRFVAAGDLAYDYNWGYVDAWPNPWNSETLASPYNMVMRAWVDTGGGGATPGSKSGAIGAKMIAGKLI